VGAEHAGGLELLELLQQAAGVAPELRVHLHEPDALVRVHAAEWVAGVGRWVRGPVRGGEGERLEPRGAGLGEAGEEDVAGPGL